MLGRQGACALPYKALTAVAASQPEMEKNYRCLSGMQTCGSGNTGRSVFYRKAYS